MEPNKKPDYMNERVFCRNRLPPRAYFLPEQTLLLSGQWRFHFTTSPLDADPASDDTSDWSLITVPGHWSLQGYGHPHYTNFQFPFPCNIPNVPSYNETGHYETQFAVPDYWHDQGDLTYRLRFEGVDSAYHLFVNGKEIGYNQGSRNPAEFDITHVVASGPNDLNTLRVKVYKWSDGSYIEDQDMWWLSGIFRDVYLLAFPKKAHVEDFFVRTSFDEDMKNATLEVDITPELECAVELRLILTDLDGKSAAPMQIREMSSSNQTLTYSMKVTNPKKWNAETPNLYSLAIILSANDKVFQKIEQRIGFRTVKIYDGLLHVNGTPILFRGVNRHDNHPRFGRAVPLDFIRHDLLQMKKHNINAFRCSHYPNDPRLVGMADEIGLYVIDEADLECHGMGVDFGNLPSAQPSWKGAYLDRMHQLVHRDKNHPSVILWSLGNESWYGQNHQAMYEWSKSFDKTRPVHYENDHEFRCSDVISYMYLSLDDLVNQATQDGDNYEKPVILQEYLHSMGNGPGNAQEYIDIFRRYRRLQGGFVWEWANHGILKPVGDCSGRSFYAYGGDFGDEPNDGNFVLDGLCGSEHLPGPGLLELKCAYQPIAIQLQENVEFVDIRIQNLFDFQSLNDLACFVSLRSFRPNGQEVVHASQFHSLEGIQPTEFKTISAWHNSTWNSEARNTETWLTVSIRTITDHIWSDAGFEVAHKDICLNPGAKPPLGPIQSLQNPKINANARLLHVGLATCTLQFDLLEARLRLWRYKGHDLIYNGLGPKLTFWRALTDNDKGGAGQGGDWLNHRVNEMMYEVRSVQHKLNPESGVLEILIESYIAPPVLVWGFITKTRYTIHSDGKILIDIRATPTGSAPGTLPRVGIEMTLPQQQKFCQWFGLGPDQTYRDMKSAGKVGVWEKPIEQAMHMYEMPQETGNHTETRWVKVLDERGNGIKAILQQGEAQVRSTMTETPESSRNSASEQKEKMTPPNSPLDDWEHVQHDLLEHEVSTGRIGFDFAVSKYTATELDRAQHPYELKESGGTVFRVDADHHGLGSASCGPDVLDKYKLKTGEFKFTVSLEPVAT